MRTKWNNVGKVLATGCLLAGLACGCSWSIGGAKEGSVSHEPTRGQELIDLKKAKDLGAISEQEYEAQRNKIMSK